MEDFVRFKTLVKSLLGEGKNYGKECRIFLFGCDGNMNGISDNEN